MAKNKTIDVRSIILKILKQKGYAQVSDIIETTSFSRAYINRFFKQLRDDGKVALIGKANKARYFPVGKSTLQKAKGKIHFVHRILQNQNLAEDQVLTEIKEKSGIYFHLFENVKHILDYTFTEMLNNAIEHSESARIWIWFKHTNGDIYFRVLDRGIGIYNNIILKKKLKNELEAIQDLIKGKQTTAPVEHSGEDIYFTSKVADCLIIKGSNKKLIFDNIIGDVFIEDIKTVKGTDVEFWISKQSKTKLNDIFQEYTGDTFEFGKTKVEIKLYKSGSGYISRSQARRVLSGLEKFKEIILDFKNVHSMGQGFADEVFRVWQRRNPQIKISEQNADENIRFMIKHVKEL
ncbi:MAG: DUF4325 domain-containing protein [Bacteroidetes bacterium]|nr:DUF4325 domain-containing protein [Bacteroidota bacterium]